ncbi:hypothetical protein ACP4OV_013313, partial [Aristida adscensionis]
MNRDAGLMWTSEPLFLAHLALLLESPQPQLQHLPSALSPTEPKQIRRAEAAAEGGAGALEDQEEVRWKMDPDTVKSTLSNLAFGNVIAAAARDYQKEILAKEKAQATPASHDEVDLDELL